MELWIIASLTGTALLAAGAWLVVRRGRSSDAGEPWSQPRHSQPWDSPSPPREGSIVPLPPPAGLFVDELSGSLNLESQELSLFDDDEPTGPIPRVLVRAAGRTLPREGESKSSDALLISREHELYAVGDGTGGYATGGVAANVLMETLEEVFDEGEFGSLDREETSRRGAELVASLHRAHDRIRARAESDPQLAGMGTTVVAMRVSPRRKRLYVSHVGDSRCYRLRDGLMDCLTADHTLGALGLDGPQAQKLSRAVGALSELDVDLRVDEPRAHDVYLLCSDGLSDALSHEAIRDLLAARASAEHGVDLLLDAARDAEAQDDVTAVVVEVDEPFSNVDESGPHRLPGV
ncbi:MAG: PP2C family serine/threonine-protein phosphatase [Sandaracinaceae bacterium]